MHVYVISRLIQYFPVSIPILNNFLTSYKGALFPLDSYMSLFCLSPHTMDLNVVMYKRDHSYNATARSP